MVSLAVASPSELRTVLSPLGLHLGRLFHFSFCQHISLCPSNTSRRSTFSREELECLSLQT